MAKEEQKEEENKEVKEEVTEKVSETEPVTEKETEPVTEKETVEEVNSDTDRIEELEPTVSKKIGSIQFSVLSPKMIKKMAAAKVVTP